MKENKLIEMQNRIANLENMFRQMIPEMSKVSDVAFGTMETLKLMPGYKKALDKLVEKHNKAKEQIEEKIRLRCGITNGLKE